MKLIKLKSTTNGTRHQLNIQKSLLSKTNKLMKSSIYGFKSFFGRSATNGRITFWHRGGGCKSLFRKIENTSQVSDSLVLCTMYDPNRSAFTFLNFDLNKKVFFRTLATHSVNIGSLISCIDSKIDFCLGSRMKLKYIPTGSILHSFSINSQTSATYARSAGTFCQLIQKSLYSGKIRLPSGIIVTVSLESFANLGIVSNIQHNLTCLGKAGRNRLRGRRPIVRGVAMNPVDHPHGGRTNGGRPSVTPWGIPTKGKPTVIKKFK